ncbi:alkaline phosphatase family protein [Longimicrobium sp.]|uniref:alkaline phosphatase family protein n=1 Tax=Longimicrobium sp. TaxID=2029185 RepID=UPI002E359E8D|nr:alkaline phosphatase family protein [Longimicrobium sp.]HEX6037403.1 alkaline phosphatase family protein [Longimicrobium sp.]
MRTLSRRTAALVFGAITLVLSGCARTFGPAEPRPGALARHVVVISIDGLRPDAIEAAGARNLQRMMQEGAYSLQAQTIMPSRTLPSHTSMLTGVEPSVHGITWNDEQVEAQGRVRVSTVFDMADSAHLETAAFFGKAKFRHLIHGDAPDEVEAPRGSEVVLAPRITQDVIQYLQFNRPDLLFVHLPDPDIAGHSAGWMTLPYRWAVRRADAAVEQIRRAAVRAYGNDVVVIVTADHGGHGRDHGTAAPEDVNIPWIAWGAGVQNGRIAASIHTYDTAATALWILGVPVPTRWEGRPVATAFQPSAIAAAEAAAAAAHASSAGNANRQ